MSEDHGYSLLIASDFAVPEPGRVWPLLQRREAALADIGAHHVGVYTATGDQGRVLVTIGVRNRDPIVDLLRSRVFFDWFDAVGVPDLPAVFAGEKAAKFELIESAKPGPPEIVVAAMAAVDDVSALVADVRSALDQFSAAGISNLWIFRAFDNQREVLVLHELTDDDSARAWIDHPAPAAVWMAGAGQGVYPPLFVGTLTQMMRVEV